MSQQHTLRNQIKKIESHTGNGTELITLTVPADKTLETIQTRIAQEHANAEHIKTDSTRS